MADKDQQKPATELEALANENKEIKEGVTRGQKYVMYAMVAISAIALLVVIYIFAIRNPAVKSANEAISQADVTMMQGNDSLALAQYQQVAKEYGYDAGNRANLMSATLLYQKGEYAQAIEYLKDYKPTEAIVGAAAQSLEGDCYVNLKNYDEAIKCFDEAIKTSDNNPLYTPLFLLKKATVLRAQGKYAEELKVLEMIRDSYPEYGQTYRLDINKYIARAKYQAEAK